MSEVTSLPKAGELPEGFLDAGVHLVKIKEVKQAKDKNGSPVVSRNGDPAYTFVFKSKPDAKNPKGYKLEQNFYTGKGQGIMDIYIQATGADNSNGPVALSEVLDKPLWIFVRKKITRVGGVVEMKDGKPVSYNEAFGASKFFGMDKVPVLAESEFVTYYDKPAATMPTIGQAPVQAPKPSGSEDYPANWDNGTSAPIQGNSTEPGW